MGFVKSPYESSLDMDLVTWEGDPLLGIVNGWNRREDNVLVAGIGVELSSRRRNKFAGWIESLSVDEDDKTNVHLQMHVNNALGYVYVT